MTSVSLNSKLNTKAITPNPMSATCGKFFVGCNFANTLKNSPSFAAAYGTREYPSITANKLAKAIQRIKMVPTVAAFVP